MAILPNPLLKQQQAALPTPVNPSPAAAAMLQQRQAVASAAPRVPPANPALQAQQRTVAVGEPRRPVVANPDTGNAVVGRPRVPVAVSPARPVRDPLAAVNPVDQQIRQRQAIESAKLGRPRGLATNIPIPR